MLAGTLKTIPTLMGAHAALWVPYLHAAVLSFVGAAVIWPWLMAAIHHLPRTREIEWMKLWRCPECGTFNRQTFIACSHCEYHLTLGFWRRRMPTLLSEKIARAVRRLVFLYALFGWLLFYAAIAGAVWKLQLYTFYLAPIQELLAALTLALGVIGLLFFRLAFSPRKKSPLGAVLDAASGVGVVCLTAIGFLLWASAGGDIALAHRIKVRYPWLHSTIETPPPVQPAAPAATPKIRHRQ